MVNTGVQTLMKRRRERLQALLEQLAQHGQGLRKYLATPGILAKRYNCQKERERERDHTSASED